MTTASTTHLAADSASLWARYRDYCSNDGCPKAVPADQLLEQANAYAASYAVPGAAMVSTDSHQFRALFRKVVPEMYPDLQRVFFIHIPRTAGSDFRESLRSKGQAIINHDIDKPWSPGLRDHFDKVDEAVRSLEAGADRIFLFGHFDPDYYRGLGLVRAQDIVFCTVRDPFDIALSHLKFEARILSRDPSLREPGTAEFASRFGLLGAGPQSALQWEALVDSLLGEKLAAVAGGDFAPIAAYREILPAYTRRWCVESPGLLPVPMRAVHYADYGKLKERLGLDASTRRNYTRDFAVDFSGARSSIVDQWHSEYRLYETLGSAPIRLFDDEFSTYFS